MLLEICAVNLQSAKIAQSAGAHRIELCMALDSGGLTPSAGLIEATRAALDIPVHVLIRPREGDFCYTEADLDMMLTDIAFCAQAGVAGVVIGALDNNRRLQRAQMEAMCRAAGSLHVTCHRAFDFTIDPFEALDTLVELGIGRVLTSGQAATAFEGRALLGRLVAYAGERIEVMPGAGIDENNIGEVARASGARSFHLTAKRKIVQDTSQQNIPRLEWSYWESDPAVIRQILEG
jgi:copper homeostasis protein